MKKWQNFLTHTNCISTHFDMENWNRMCWIQLPNNSTGNYMLKLTIETLKKQLSGPFLCMGFNCLEASEPLRGNCFLFTTKSPGTHGTYFTNLGRMKSWVDLAVWAPTSRFTNRKTKTKRNQTIDVRIKGQLNLDLGMTFHVSQKAVAQ